MTRDRETRAVDATAASPRRLRAVLLFTTAYAALGSLDPSVAAAPAFFAFLLGAAALSR